MEISVSTNCHPCRSLPRVTAILVRGRFWQWPHTRATTRPERGLQAKSLRRIFDPIRTAEGVTLLNTLANRRQFAIRKRHIHSLDPIGQTRDWPARFQQPIPLPIDSSKKWDLCIGGMRAV